MMPSTEHAPRETGRLYLAVGLMSAAALAYEILLMRLLSIIQWHHFAYMIISLALLGYGVSGTLLTLIKGLVPHRFPTLFALNAAAFALTAPGCFELAQRAPFNGLELLWDPSQALGLVSLYLLLSLPFVFAANCIGLTFMGLQARIPRLYQWDLCGAGAGALAVMAALNLISPQACLWLIAALGLVSASLVSAGDRPRTWILAGSVGAALLVLWSVAGPKLKITPYKGLPKALQVVGARIVVQRSSPLGLLSVLESPQVPLRYAPGLSLAATQEPPAQLGVFTDADAMSVITRFDGKLPPLAYLDQLSSALPYHLLDHPQVLILGAGGGMDVLQALYHDASHTDAVELNPQMVELMRSQFAPYAGELYRHPKVSLHTAEARAYLARDSHRHDLIQISMLDSFAAAGAGTHALNENYLYTVEALEAMLAHLREGGYLAITRWLKLPPRDAPKLFATALEALRRSGVERPELQLTLIRSWQTTTLLVKRGRLSATDIEALRAFCRERWFDTAYFPDIRPREANRYNVLREPIFFETAAALASDEGERLIRDYKFNLTPATDERPYFFHFFRWKSLSELLALREQGSQVLLDAGYFILIATLLQAVPLSALLVLLPLALLGRRRIRSRGTGAAGIYFVALGLAFLFLEIAFIQRFIVFIGHPLYTVATVLSGFLVFAGLGSALSPRLQGRFRARPQRAVDSAVAAIGVISLGYLFGLPALFALAMALPTAVKIVITLVLIAPLALCMGMPFPLGLARLAQGSPDFIPWAWGINGCASVLSVLLASLLAIHFGFGTVLILAVGLYGVAALALRLSDMFVFSETRSG
jgi:spermidine synthase